MSYQRQMSTCSTIVWPGLRKWANLSRRYEILNLENRRSGRFLRDKDAKESSLRRPRPIGDRLGPRGSRGWSAPTSEGAGKQYLSIYGTFQATFIQQDAICDVYHFVTETQLDTSNLGGWSEIRDLRNSITGHPMNRGERWRTISRISIEARGFEIMSWDKKQTTFREIRMSVGGLRDRCVGVFLDCLKDQAADFASASSAGSQGSERNSLAATPARTGSPRAATLALTLLLGDEFPRSLTMGRPTRGKLSPPSTSLRL